jgi:glycosyltransferase involved in cell wall biosynthesis
MKVCFVTQELSEVIGSGGIGACVSGLVRVLAHAGHTVTVIFTNHITAEHRSFAEAVKMFAENGVILRRIAHIQISEEDFHLSLSYSIYEELKSGEFDVIHFHDWLGLGYYTCVGKRSRLHFNDTLLITHAHGPSVWTRLGNEDHRLSLAALELDQMERIQIEYSDLIVSPSKYMLKWLQTNGFKFETGIFKHWVLSLEPSPEKCTGKVSEFDELVFFGRHERRKGFELFIDAIVQDPEVYTQFKTVSFIGRFDKINHENTVAYALRRLRSFPGKLKFVGNFDQNEAIFYIRQANALCVIPSLEENSPCVVGECLAKAVPFLSTDVGGIRELLAKSQHSKILFKPTAVALTEKIASVLRFGTATPKASYDVNLVVNDWLRLHTHEEITKYKKSSNSRFFRKSKLRPHKQPFISVCVVHHNRAEFLARQLWAIKTQTFDNYEVIVVDDGSSEVEVAKFDELALSENFKNWSFIKQSNRYLGAARNVAAKAAVGQYLLFMDDDNVALPHQLEIFAKIAVATQWDVITSMCYHFTDGADFIKEKKINYFPMISPGEIGFFRNRFGDANSLIRRESFETVGGFTEICNVGVEDWELFIAMQGQGFKFGLIPEPLFYYRISSEGMLATSSVQKNWNRIANTLEKNRPRLSREVFQLVSTPYLESELLSRTRENLRGIALSSLHSKLLEMDPGDVAALATILDMMIKYGRLEEAIEFRNTHEINYHFDWEIITAAARASVAFRRDLSESKHLVGIRRISVRAVVLEGWVVTDRSTPLEIGWLEDSAYPAAVECVSISPRADVDTHFSLPPGCTQGFVIVVRYSASDASLPKDAEISAALANKLAIYSKSGFFPLVDRRFAIDRATELVAWNIRFSPTLEELAGCEVHLQFDKVPSIVLYSMAHEIRVASADNIPNPDNVVRIEVGDGYSMTESAEYTMDVYFPEGVEFPLVRARVVGKSGSISGRVLAGSVDEPPARTIFHPEDARQK